MSNGLSMSEIKYKDFSSDTSALNITASQSQQSLQIPNHKYISTSSNNHQIPTIKMQTPTLLTSLATFLATSTSVSALPTETSELETVDFGAVKYHGEVRLPSLPPFYFPFRISQLTFYQDRQPKPPSKAATS
jgi:hypothetical protein